MNKLVWRGETVNGKYLGEVALLTDLSPVVHCETFVDGNWRLWSYVDDREQVLQQGKTPSLKEAQYICEQTALALQGVQGLQNASDMPMQPMMPVFMSVMPNMYAQAQQDVYENVQPSRFIQELRFKFRRWAISLTLIGCVFLSIWYSMMLKPVSTISLLLVLTSIIWGAQAIIKSFKRSRISASPPPTHMDDGITIFSTSQVRPSRRQQRVQQVSHHPQLTTQLAPQFMPAQQLGFTSNQFVAHQQNALGLMNSTMSPMSRVSPMSSMPQPAMQQALVHVAPQLQAPQTIQTMQPMQPIQLQPMQPQQAQANFPNQAAIHMGHMQPYQISQRSNG